MALSIGCARVRSSEGRCTHKLEFSAVAQRVILQRLKQKPRCLRKHEKRTASCGRSWVGVGQGSVRCGQGCVCVFFWGVVAVACVRCFICAFSRARSCACVHAFRVVQGHEPQRGGCVQLATFAMGSEAA